MNINAYRIFQDIEDARLGHDMVGNLSYQDIIRTAAHQKIAHVRMFFLYFSLGPYDPTRYAKGRVGSTRCIMAVPYELMTHLDISNMAFDMLPSELTKMASHTDYYRVLIMPTHIGKDPHALVPVSEQIYHYLLKYHYEYIVRYEDERPYNVYTP